jgi:hypothetical protein
VVTYEQDYFIKFPDDAIEPVCDGSGVYGVPSFFGEDCELLGVSYEDEVFTVVPDACFKIERTWTIINWCTYNPNLPCIYVPNPNPFAITNAPGNRPGPTVSACGTLPPWAPTVVKINPTDPTATNFCTFYDKDANCYKYKQIIKIIDGQAPTGTYTVPDCSNQNWLTPNNSQLWNEMYWWDNGIQTHDLCEEPTDLCITGTDACSGSNVNIEYLLFLDLDGDNIMETVVNSVTRWHRRSRLEQRAVRQPEHAELRWRHATPVRRAQRTEQPEMGLLHPGDRIRCEQDCLRTLEHPGAAEHPRGT